MDVAFSGSGLNRPWSPGTDVSTWAFSLTESLFHDLECTPFPGMLYVALTSSARECYGPGRSFEPGRNNQQLRGFKC